MCSVFYKKWFSGSMMYVPFSLLLPKWFACFVVQFLDSLLDDVLCGPPVC